MTGGTKAAFWSSVRTLTLTCWASIVFIMLGFLSVTFRRGPEVSPVRIPLRIEILHDMTSETPRKYHSMSYTRS